MQAKKKQMLLNKAPVRETVSERTHEKVKRISAYVHASVRESAYVYF